MEQLNRICKVIYFPYSPVSLASYALIFNELHTDRGLAASVRSVSWLTRACVYVSGSS